MSWLKADCWTWTRSFGSEVGRSLGRSGGVLGISVLPGRGQAVIQRHVPDQRAQTPGVARPASSSVAGSRVLRLVGDRAQIATEGQAWRPDDYEESVLDRSTGAD